MPQHSRYKFQQSIINREIEREHRPRHNQYQFQPSKDESSRVKDQDKKRQGREQRQSDGNKVSLTSMAGKAKRTFCPYPITEYSTRNKQFFRWN
ncbi:hypothetical protein EUGRSUZ_L01352 [Eucalyptus grandis]|uniref:Uncharacterized protein n=1 Tax=Eucalyptus grandis TaxID=71139 RepID=A0A058ZUK8_EUCGR|nr:hypothetical protein EUGRSUZ_L01352 [Eucalyptus grandis]